MLLQRILVAISILTAGCFASEAEPPDLSKLALHELARLVAAEDASPEKFVVEELLRRESTWAFDLIHTCQTAAKKIDTTRQTLYARAVFCSHFIGTKRAQDEFLRAWNSIAEHQQAQLLQMLVEWYEEGFSGLTWHHMPATGRDLLAAIVSKKEQREKLGDAADKLLGRQEVVETRTDARFLEAFNEITKDERNLTSNEFFALAGEARRRLASNAAMIRELDPAMKRVFVHLRGRGERGEWPRLLINRELLLALGLAVNFGVRPELSVQEAMEGAVLDAIKLLVLSGRFKGGIESKSADEMLLSAALHEFARVSSSLDPGNVRAGEPAAKLSYKKAPPPFSYFIADIRARDGSVDARKYLLEAFHGRLSGAIALQKRRISALEIEDYSTVNETVKEIEVIVDELASMLRYSRLARDELAANKEQVQTAVQDLSCLGAHYVRLHDSTAQESKPVDQQLSIKTALQNYREKNINLRELIEAARSLHALDNADVYQAYKTDIEGRKEVSDDVSVCKLIGYSGGAEDVDQLAYFWLNIRMDVREALIAAAEKKKLRGLLDDLLPRYERMKHPELRRLVAHLLRELSQPQDVELLLAQLAEETDEVCLDFLAGALLRLTCDERSGVEAMTKMTAAVQSEPYGQRMFYLARILCAAYPELNISIDCFGHDPDIAQQMKRALGRIRTFLDERKEREK